MDQRPGMRFGIGRAVISPAARAYSYNAARAYSHFLRSPYSYRTYSGTVMPYRVEAYTPYSHERFATGPGYVHQRITPHGHG